MKITISFVLIIFSAALFSQTLLSSAGNDVDTETLSISWTLGEVAIATLNSDDLILSQGFQQGNLIVEVIEGIQPQLKTYPNPFIDKLIIESVTLDLLFDVVDMKGIVVKNGFIDANPFELDLTDLPYGTYFLRVEHIRTYKIIKVD